jgi:hypothetical protein
MFVYVCRIGVCMCVYMCRCACMCVLMSANVCTYNRAYI